MSVLRVIHVSDTHYGSAPAVKTVGSYARAATWRFLVAKGLSACKGAQGHDPLARKGMLSAIYGISRQQDVDGLELVHSGDLTAAGDLDGLKRELDDFASTIGRPELDTVTLGNHDLWPGQFPAIAPEDTAAHAPVVKRLLPGRDDFPKFCGLWRANDLVVQFYALDTCIVDSYWNWRACGKLCDIYFGTRRLRQLEALARLISRVDQSCRSSATPIRGHARAIRVAVLHHPIIDFHGHNRMPLTPMALIDRGADRELSDLGFRLVLCGHEHVSRPNSIDAGPLLQISVGTPTHKGDPHQHFTVFHLKPIYNSKLEALELQAETWVRSIISAPFLSPKQQVACNLLAPGETGTFTWNLDLSSHPEKWAKQ